MLQCFSENTTFFQRYSLMWKPVSCTAWAKQRSPRYEEGAEGCAPPALRQQPRKGVLRESLHSAHDPPEELRNNEIQDLLKQLRGPEKLHGLCVVSEWTASTREQYKEVTLVLQISSLTNKELKNNGYLFKSQWERQQVTLTILFLKLRRSNKQARICKGP